MKNKFNVKIMTIDNVKKFVQICEHYKEDIDLRSGRYIIDAKSIMGIFSFDLTKPLEIYINTNNTDIIQKFNDELNEFKCD